MWIEIFLYLNLIASIIAIALGINLKSPWSSSTCVIKGLCNLHFSHQMNAQLIHASVSCEFCTQLKCTLLHLSWQWCHKIFLETHQKPHWPPIIAVHFLLISGRWSVIIHHQVNPNSQIIWFGNQLPHVFPLWPFELINQLYMWWIKSWKILKSCPSKYLEKSLK